HLASGALQRREENGVYQCRFGVFELRRNISRDPKVWVLVDSTGNERGNFKVFLGVCAENLREGIAKRRGSLYGCKVNLADVVRVLETKHALGLVDGNVP